jgi:methylated-DNA-[protein]-cysteine S-methyltransferase
MDSKETSGRRRRGAALEDALLEAAWEQLAEYLDGVRVEFDLPTATSGSDFQERVWALLREIPYGETTTYGAIAERLGDRALAREVGGAVGRNPLSIVVGCHRVIGADGSLTGYAGGLDRKRSLLELEGSIDPEPVALF